jgi:O-antigen/teichoic acid export membrane protein
MARLYGAAEMGAYFLAVNLLSILSVVCCLGLDIGLLRFTAALQAKGALGNLPRIFWPACGVVVLLGSLAGLGIYVGQDWLGSRFRSPGLASLLVFAALALPLLILYRLVSETVRALGGIRWLSLEENLKKRT